jgi:hypothetical protein
MDAPADGVRLAEQVLAGQNGRATQARSKAGEILVFQSAILRRK